MDIHLYCSEGFCGMKSTIKVPKKHGTTQQPGLLQSSDIRNWLVFHYQNYGILFEVR